MPVMCLYFASFGGQTPSAPGASRSGSDCIAIGTMDDEMLNMLRPLCYSSTMSMKNKSLGGSKLANKAGSAQ